MNEVDCLKGPDNLIYTYHGHQVICSLVSNL